MLCSQYGMGRNVAVIVGCGQVLIFCMHRTITVLMASVSQWPRTPLLSAFEGSVDTLAAALASPDPPAGLLTEADGAASGVKRVVSLLRLRARVPRKNPKRCWFRLPS